MPGGTVRGGCVPRPPIQFWGVWEHRCSQEPGGEVLFFLFLLFLRLVVRCGAFLVDDDDRKSLRMFPGNITKSSKRVD